MNENYLSVAQINQYIKNIFEAEIMLQNVCVYGEVSSYTISNGIAYFNIKDDNNLLACVLFNALRFETPKIGDLVLVTGSVSYYAKGGKLSFQATQIAPYGRGLLYERFLELKNKLEKLGYFNLDRKKPVPKRVSSIGVVTSPTGAVIQDIIDVTTRRNNTVNIVVYPVKVQGVGAELEIAKGIEFFSNYDKVDCIIVARGGGSMEDLQPFNTEIVANATYLCKKPIVSAVGHETDFTIIDFVSDLRAPTPSAAAELVVNSKAEEVFAIENQILHIEKSLKNIGKRYLFTVQGDLISMQNEIANKLTARKELVTQSLSQLNYGVQNAMNRYDNNVKMLEFAIVKANPTAMLKKGYAKLEKGNHIVNSIEQVKESDMVQFHLYDGKISAVVTNVEKGAKHGTR